MIFAFSNAFGSAFEDKVKKTTFTKFSDITSLVAKDSFGGIDLNELLSNVKKGINFGVMNNNETYGYSLYGSKNKDDIGLLIVFQCGGNCYKKFGTTYDQAVADLTKVANRMVARKLPKGDFHYPIGDEYGIKWRWDSSGFKCAISLDNEKYFSGNLSISCELFDPPQRGVGLAGDN